MPIRKDTIVVVDDDASMSLAMTRILHAAGFHATTFSSGEELLRAAGAGVAACLVVDVRLPGLSGFELVERLAERRVFAPVIFVTAHDEPANREQADKSAAIAYLVKPFHGKALIDAVHRAVDAHV